MDVVNLASFHKVSEFEKDKMTYQHEFNSLIYGLILLKMIIIVYNLLLIES